MQRDGAWCPRRRGRLRVTTLTLGSASGGAAVAAAGVCRRARAEEARDVGGHLAKVLGRGDAAVPGGAAQGRPALHGRLGSPAALRRGTAQLSRIQVSEDLLQAAQLAERILVAANAFAADGLLDAGGLEEVKLRLRGSPDEAVHRAVQLTVKDRGGGCDRRGWRSCRKLSVALLYTVRRHGATSRRRGGDKECGGWRRLTGGGGGGGGGR